MDKKVSSQGIAERDVAYQLGRNCPIGQEPVLLAGLDKWWPDLQSRVEALNAFLRGLADRFQVEA